MEGMDHGHVWTYGDVGESSGREAALEQQNRYKSRCTYVLTLRLGKAGTWQTSKVDRYIPTRLIPC